MQDKRYLEEKRLVVWLNKSFHHEIKRRSVVQNVSIRKWIEEAISEKIRKEIELGFD